MEPNKALETAQIKMEMLISQRPSAFLSTVWHSAMRVIFFILGLIALVGSVMLMYSTYILYMQYQQMASAMDELLPISGMIRDNIIDRMPPELWIGYVCCGIICFLLSLTLFLLARYCRKIVKRNRYIVDVEGVWREMKILDEKKRC